MVRLAGKSLMILQVALTAGHDTSVAVELSEEATQREIGAQESKAMSQIVEIAGQDTGVAVLQYRKRRRDGQERECRASLSEKKQKIMKDAVGPTDPVLKKKRKIWRHGSGYDPGPER